MLAIEAKLKDRISINMDKQPLSEADHLPAELHGAEHRARPEGAGRRGTDLGVARELDRQSVPAQDACSKLLLKPLGLTYKLEDEVVLITSPQADAGADVSPRRTTSATWSCRRIAARSIPLPDTVMEPDR